MTASQAIQNYLERFLPSFENNSVPEGQEFPYATYSIPYSNFDETVIGSLYLWYREELPSRSWKDISDKTDEINESIGLGGVIIPYTDGSIWIKRGRPFSQRMSDEDPNVLRMYINLEIEYFTAR